MPSIETFGPEELRDCSETIRAMHHDATSMEEVGRRLVRYLRTELVDSSGRSECVLVRLYKTHSFGDLEPDVQSFAASVAGEDLAPSVRCLTLLASAGDLDDWNSRRRSRGHRAIPLLSEQMVERFPMVSQLLHQLGVDVASMVGPGPDGGRELAQKTYDVFYVPQALGSPFVPAQDDFVIPHGVRSAVGFGGFLLTGDFYAVIVFSRVAVSRSAAEFVRLLALSIRVPLLAFARGPVFEQPTDRTPR